MIGGNVVVTLSWKQCFIHFSFIKNQHDKTSLFSQVKPIKNYYPCT